MNILAPGPLHSKIPPILTLGDFEILTDNPSNTFASQFFSLLSSSDIAFYSVTHIKIILDFSLPLINLYIISISLVAQTVKRLPAMWETRVRPLAQEDPLEKEMGNPLQYSCLENPWTKERGGLQSMGSQRVEHN